MNGMGRRFTSKKDKDGGASHKRDKSRDNKSVEKSTEKKARSRSDILNWIFPNTNKKLNKSEIEVLDEKKKIEELRQDLRNEGLNDVNDEQILFCLNSKFASGDIAKALSFLIVIQQSLGGIVYPYDPHTKMLGAENPNVTCWLDSFLCSLFAVPTQFQDLLTRCYEDPSKQKLIQLIRLWVNLMRKGILIEFSITDRILDSLQECGWTDFDRAKQQDATEAHMKIGDILDWPMLNLRVDFQHGGIENEQDDHKTTKERTVPVPIITDHPGPEPVTLEQCIAESLNSLVQINRRIEPISPGATRDQAMKPTREHLETMQAEAITEESPGSTRDRDEKSNPGHLETVAAEAATTPPSPMEVADKTDPQNQLVRQVTHEQRSLYRSMSRNSTRKGIDREFTVPAFLMSRFIPWPSQPAPANNQELAQRIQKYKPMIGFDLKRYGMSENRTTIKLNTQVDIPVRMSLPHFVDDEGNQNNIPFADRFELVLRSMVCHRGLTINSGHYTSLVRLRVATDGDCDSTQPNHSQQPPDYAEDIWMVHDDMADERVRPADIEQALKHDKYGTPVTLWYELVPTYEGFLYEELPQSSMDNTTPPSYTALGVPSIDVQVAKASPDDKQGLEEGYFTSQQPTENSTVRFSAEIDRHRVSLNLPDEDRRGSVAITDASSVSAGKSDTESAPVTPGEEPTSNRVSRTFRRSKIARSRPPSASNENRNAFGYFKNLVSRASKESLHKPDQSKESIPPVPEIPSLDGFADPQCNGESTKSVEAIGTPSRKGSKKGKKRSQSRGDVSIEAKVKSSNDQDRVCNIM